MLWGGSGNHVGDNEWTTPLRQRCMSRLSRCTRVAIFTSHMNVDMPLRSPQALVSRCIASFDKVGSIPAIAPSALQGQSAGIRRSEHAKLKTRVKDVVLLGE